MCQWPRCHATTEIIYAAVRPSIELCDSHWEKLCELEGESKMNALRRISPDVVLVAPKESVPRPSKADLPVVPVVEVPVRRGPTQLPMFELQYEG